MNKQNGTVLYSKTARDLVTLADRIGLEEPKSQAAKDFVEFLMPGGAVDEATFGPRFSAVAMFIAYCAARNITLIRELQEVSTLLATGDMLEDLLAKLKEPVEV